MDAAVGIEHRIGGIGAEPARAHLVRDALQRNLLAQIGGARNQLLGAIDLAKRVHETLVELAVCLEIVFRVVQNNPVAVQPDAIVRIGEIFVKTGDPVAPGAPILSLTEPNFTVTLQASPSDRTKLQVGQHCTVELVGGENQVSGTISELDADQTSVSSSTPGQAQQQVYEGQIEVSDLGAADGAAVSINVIDQQATDVLTVPVAAVKQNGVGQDVVRVINLAAGGKITEAPVSTGLPEGSYIEVTKGLTENEKVIVDVNQPT